MILCHSSGANIQNPSILCREKWHMEIILWTIVVGCVRFVVTLLLLQRTNPIDLLQSWIKFQFLAHYWRSFISFIQGARKIIYKRTLLTMHFLDWSCVVSMIKLALVASTSSHIDTRRKSNRFVHDDVRVGDQTHMNKMSIPTMWKFVLFSPFYSKIWLFQSIVIIRELKITSMPSLLAVQLLNITKLNATLL